MSPHEGQWEPDPLEGVAFVWKRRPYAQAWLSEEPPEKEGER